MRFLKMGTFSNIATMLLSFLIRPTIIPQYHLIRSPQSNFSSDSQNVFLGWYVDSQVKHIYILHLISLKKLFFLRNKTITSFYFSLFPFLFFFNNSLKIRVFYNKAINFAISDTVFISFKTALLFFFLVIKHLICRAVLRLTTQQNAKLKLAVKFYCTLSTVRLFMKAVILFYIH